jgi:type I restriction enzyme S subunit
LDKVAQGSTVRNLNTKIVSKVNIPIPTIREQEEVIKKAEHLSKNIKSLKKGYLEKISFLEELKQSLLQKAFKGEL